MNDQTENPQALDFAKMRAVLSALSALATVGAALTGSPALRLAAGLLAGLADHEALPALHDELSK